MTVQTILILVIVGIIAGMLSGLVGIGGGIVIVPALVFFFRIFTKVGAGNIAGNITFTNRYFSSSSIL